jgi:heat shock protein HslJ
MPEEKKTEEKKEGSKKKNNVLLIAAIVILALCGVYYFYTNQKLMSSSGNVPVTKAPSDENASLTSKKWTWVNTQMSDGSESLPSNEGQFTLTFQDDMRVLATTDCNNGNGSYELGPDNSLTMGPMATTMMFCEGSTETEFYQGLSNVGSYKIDNGQLWLMLKFDSGTMIFE